MVKVDVEKIAELAYLSLSPEEMREYQGQFEKILQYVDSLNEIPMSESEAKQMGVFHILTAFYERFQISTLESLRNEDEHVDVNSLRLSNEEALKNAPKSSGLPGELLFEVPSIIER